jgi:cholesterol transport system auxiliary component
MRTTLLACSTAAALTGCALLGKHDPVVPRYFTPEYAAAPGATRAAAGRALRLGRVEGWSNLRERWVVRDQSGATRYAEDRRWTERPEIYLRRALSRALFEERGLVEALSGRTVALEVELVAFEEVEGPHRVRLQALLVLRDDRLSLYQETVSVEQAVAPGDEAGRERALIEAYSAVLRAGVTRIADQVVTQLVSLPAQASR